MEKNLLIIAIINNEIFFIIDCSDFWVFYQLINQ